MVTDGPSSSDFRPYIKTIDVKGCPFRFFFATNQARDWYDPIKPHAMAEYEWVVANIDLKHQKIVDGGAHHGQYSVLFGVASEGSSQIVSVDAVESNCAITEVNLALNGVKSQIIRSAISQVDGTIQFSEECNGHIVATGGEAVPSRRLISVMPDATVVKLDVEGAEFWILPDSIDQMRSVHTWIVEVHPTARRHPSVIIDLFQSRGLKLDWVNKATGKIEPYPAAADWSTHTTIFARRI